MFKAQAIRIVGDWQCPVCYVYVVDLHRHMDREHPDQS